MYQLIALDMDGTLLTGRKTISPRTLEAISDAACAGKHVVINTGRCPVELSMYEEEFRSIRYLNCISGALVYDKKEKYPIFTGFLDPDIVKQLLAICRMEDTMPQLLSDKSHVQADQIPKMSKYHMAIYQTMFESITTKMEDVFAQYYESPFPVNKFNAYHTSQEARLRTRQRILDAGLPVSLADAEITSLEISPRGIDKGTGLKKLCEHLKISTDEMIVVGDADNDLAALGVAGLPIAMANANEHVKAISKVTVADNDHDGCAEAIYRYLLG